MSLSSYRWVLLSVLVTGCTMQGAGSVGQFGLAESQNFCPNGQPDLPSLRGTRPNGQKVWGSYCQDGYQGTGRAETGWFSAPATLSIYIAGYPSSPGNLLRLEEFSTRASLLLKPEINPREVWRLHQFRLPEEWRGKTVRLVAEHHSKSPEGWFAFGLAQRDKPGFAEPGAWTLFFKTVAGLICLALPPLGLCCLAVRKGVRNALLLPYIALCSIGVVGYLSFWLWFFSPTVGRAVTACLPFAAAAFTFFTIRRMTGGERVAMRSLIFPAGFSASVALLVLSIGFLYGGLDSPLGTAERRFSDPLPADNSIPFLFAAAIAHGHVDKPLIGDWLSSDRPPLQTGIYLAQYVYAPGRLGYTIVGVALQCLWAFALPLLLKALGCHERAWALAVLVCLGSGFLLQNSFYVWPKLLAATYTIAAGALLLSRRFCFVLESKLGCWLVGAMVAFSMLSHGGSIFALAGLGLCVLLLRKNMPLRSTALVCSAAVIVYLPWVGYQKYFDPPGDRLLKMHLAGVEKVDSRSFTQAFAAAYRNMSGAQWLANKTENLKAITGDQKQTWRGAAALIGGVFARKSETSYHSASDLRVFNFFHLLSCLGFLAIGPLALVAGFDRNRRTPEWRSAGICWLWAAISTAIWCLLMFQPGATILHQGAYAIVLLGLVGSVLAFWAVSPVLAIIAVILEVGLNLLTYFVALQRPVPERTVSDQFLRGGMLTLTLVALAMVLILLYSWALDGKVEARD